MRVDRETLRLYAVTDRAWARDEAALFRQIEAAVRGGAGVVQLREKDMEPAAFLEEAKRFADSSASSESVTRKDSPMPHWAMPLIR